MSSFCLLLLYMVVCMVLIALILLQRGKGADMGSSFGAGASATVFGAAGSASFLVKITAFFGLLFFSFSILLGVILSHAKSQDNIQVALQSAANETAKPADVTPLPKLPDSPQPVN